jgi:hypothetical protein
MEFPQLLQKKLIKCDVEGFELFIFQGAADILENRRPYIILEICHSDKHGYKNDNLYQYLHALNYKWFAMLRDKSLAEVSSAMIEGRGL